MTPAKKITAPTRGAFMDKLKKGTAAAGEAAPAAAPETAKRGTGRISFKGRLPVLASKDDEKAVLVRMPAKLLEALDAHVVGARAAVIVAMLADATQRAQAGESIDFDAATVAQWYQ